SSMEQGTLTNFARIVEEHLHVRARADMLVEGEDHQVIGAAVHDLKGPLTAIDGIAEMLREIPNLTQEDPSIIDDLSSSVSRLRYQLYDLLDMMVARKTASMEPVPLQELVERAVSELGHRASRMNKELRVSGEVGGLTVNGNRALLSRCLYNLIDNALKYSPRGEPVTVEVARGDQEARIAVSDRGVGIPPEMRERVFEPGLRLHGEHSGSVGLGLSSAKKAAEMHSGTLRLRTDTQIGTTFELLLPLI
ncbi:MAG: HAMP domain-containing sensor histidine kinase, partial [Myxococcota bacterium]